MRKVTPSTRRTIVHDVTSLADRLPSPTTAPSGCAQPDQEQAPGVEQGLKIRKSAVVSTPDLRHPVAHVEHGHGRHARQVGLDGTVEQPEFIEAIGASAVG
jgi:hypothetical protein